MRSFGIIKFSSVFFYIKTVERSLCRPFQRFIVSSFHRFVHHQTDEGWRPPDAIKKMTNDVCDLY